MKTIHQNLVVDAKDKMNSKLDKKLCISFPMLYNNQNIDNKNLYFDFECNNGWYKLIHQLSSNIENILKKDDLPFYAVQVKQKFGALRFYMNQTNDKINKLICDAETQSNKICEECGDIGKITNRNSYFYCLCQNCIK